ncbi:hypothetical protein CG747_09985 [Streptomyces sp. CB02959]|nr:hypothetical protein CG747_09985 [Streptomyces sp. CB02959]
MKADDALLKILACPIDKGPLMLLASEDALYNPRLRRRYPILDGIPQLLPSLGEQLSDAEHEHAVRQIKEAETTAETADTAGTAETAEKRETRETGEIEETAEAEAPKAPEDPEGRDGTEDAEATEATEQTKLPAGTAEPGAEAMASGAGAGS